MTPLATEVEVPGTRKRSHTPRAHRVMADRQSLTGYLLFLKTAHQLVSDVDRGSPKPETTHKVREIEKGFSDYNHDLF